MTFHESNTLRRRVTPEAFAAEALAPAAKTRPTEAARPDADRQRFRDVVGEAISKGVYSQLVWVHMDMSHRMHTMRGDAVGTQRFLPWHRNYLARFEAAMRSFDPDFVVPYWDWASDARVPQWLADFLPQGVVDPTGKPIPVTRDPGNSPDPAAKALPSAADVAALDPIATYTEFTLRLEGAQPFGLHNLVHDWVDGTMSDLHRSPADPLFWLHHAQVDRLWARWEAGHAGQAPRLTPAHQTLDPWPEHVADVLDIAKLGYAYA